MIQFTERAKNYELIKEAVIFVDSVELEKFEKRIVTVFVIDKRSRKISYVTKYTVIESFTSLTVKSQRNLLLHA